MKQYFYDLAEFSKKQISADEVLLLNIDGEDSQFCRFNHNLVRQAGDISDSCLTVTLINGTKHSSCSLALMRNQLEDHKNILENLQQLRDVIKILPGDPHLLYSQKVVSSENIAVNSLPDARELAAFIMAEAQGLDMVGILASGRIFRGFANSLGQKNWYEKYTFGFDWSAYLHSDKAVKSTYAGTEWNPDTVSAQISKVRLDLEVLAKPAKTLSPGNYRVYLSPTALSEVVGLLAWRAFGEKMVRTKQSPLLQMVEGVRQFHPSVFLAEDRASGLSPTFDSYGFAVAPRVQLLEGGRYKGSLISPRTAKEYSLTPNSGGERPTAINLDAGSIKQDDVLGMLGTGIYVNNLWYLNFSDESACKLTGMTRFACFWVEDGRIIAPINVMRFDESAYNLLGNNLVGLTAEREFIVSTSTYERRSVASVHVPGAIIDGCRFTL
jgi:predicted Zn-dependent protease